MPTHSQGLCVPTLLAADASAEHTVNFWCGLGGSSSRDPAQRVDLSNMSRRGRVYPGLEIPAAVPWGSVRWHLVAPVCPRP